MKTWYFGINEFGEKVFLKDFSWDCGWYWGGGYLGNRNCHYHFDSFYEDVDGKRTNLYSGFVSKMKSHPFTDSEIWRLCDLFKQFYSYKAAAECFRIGGHYTTDERKEDEFNIDMANKINDHIEHVIIREIRQLMDSVQERKKLEN